MNGGFGMVLDGSDEAGSKARNLLQWDVANGVTRRCWAGTSKFLIKSYIKYQAHNTELILFLNPYSLFLNYL